MTQPTSMASDSAAVAPLAVGVNEAARMAGLARSTFWALLASGDGPRTFMLGRRRLVRVETLNSWLAKLEKGAA